ncbi:glyceraldehyde 3-phosphate dehydrogenase NAD-binding domain-containing protein [Chitinibacter mangrovi]|uniref:glyceraldehyde 3-phosphate dehydrogenase NAD-binding domain-containing protein n=1 Tax=Chitinibacter mangrovi TaxID=3153927 RepID=UPI003D8170D0
MIPLLLAHLLNFDSIHGRWAHEATTDGDVIVVGNTRIKTSRNTDIGATDWSRLR